jgi:hypothetical protein
MDESLQDPLLESAKTLVDAAHVNAVTMFTPLLDQFSDLQKIDVEHWDFILTVAGVFAASTRLHNLCLGGVREEGLMQIVAENLDRWNPDGIRAFEDCKQLFESEYDRLIEAGHEQSFVASDAVGMWIVWNVLGRQPQTEEECKLVRTVGSMVIHNFFRWWGE